MFCEHCTISNFEKSLKVQRRYVFGKSLLMPDVCQMWKAWFIQKIFKICLLLIVKALFLITFLFCFRKILRLNLHILPFIFSDVWETSFLPSAPIRFQSICLRRLLGKLRFFHCDYLFLLSPSVVPHDTVVYVEAVLIVPSYFLWDP